MLQRWVDNASSLGLVARDPVADNGNENSSSLAEWQCFACGFKNKGTNKVCGEGGNLGCRLPWHSMEEDTPGPNGDSLEPKKSKDEVTSAPLGGTFDPPEVKSAQPVAFGTSSWWHSKDEATPGAMADTSETAKVKGVQGVAFGTSSWWDVKEEVKPKPAETKFDWKAAALPPPPPPAAPIPTSSWDSSGQIVDAFGPAKGKGSKAGPYGKGAEVAKIEGTWICSCGFANKPQNTQCGGNGPMGCKEARPFYHNTSIDGTTSWRCECGYLNRASNDVCGGIGTRGCKKERPQDMQQPNADTSSSGQVPVTSNPKEPDWKCECGFVNKFRNHKCGGNGILGCKSPRPLEITALAQPHPVFA